MLGSCQQTHSGNGISVFLTPSNWVYLSHTGRRLQFTVLSGVSVLTWTLGPLCYGLFNPPRYSVRKLSACDGENPQHRSCLIDFYAFSSSYFSHLQHPKVHFSSHTWALWWLLAKRHPCSFITHWHSGSCWFYRPEPNTNMPRTFETAELWMVSLPN